ncbi:universal stress protein [Nocardia brasiliensis]|uniref:universal stress protein n=1 Tax=Nocardia brasiliensis TaxID=37326 RepID=UPI001895110D|nr:universal stress protein [Nocardia brasiliensis]MBF6542419.1 universal stress protein [Nocardia brasiliensis]
MSTNSINPPVVVGIDGSSPADEALRWAAVDAAHHDAPLHIVFAVGARADFGPGVDFRRIDHDEYLAACTTTLAAARRFATAAAEAVDELVVDTFMVEASPIPALLDRSKDARLLVVGAHGAGAFRRGLLGSVSTALARHAHCPVAIVPEPERYSARRVRGPVVVGVDGSPCSTRAVEIAFDEAFRRKVPVRAVLTWSEFHRYLPDAEMQTEATALLSEALAGYADRYPDLVIERVIVKDQPANRLLVEGEQAQLIVVGSHGRGGFAGMTLGSVSQAVLHAADCPIIIARPQN